MTLFQNIINEIQKISEEEHLIFFEGLEDHFKIKVDPRLIMHIFINLLSNAVKYSPNGGEIRLIVKHDGDNITFKVIDHGIGIPPEAQENLFDAYQRAKNVGSIKGSGLGLSIVRQFVEMHSKQRFNFYGDNSHPLNPRIILGYALTLSIVNIK